MLIATLLYTYYMYMSIEEYENIVQQMHASIMFVIIYRSGFVNKTLTFEPVSKRAPHVGSRRLCTLLQTYYIMYL